MTIENDDSELGGGEIAARLIAAFLPGLPRAAARLSLEETAVTALRGYLESDSEPAEKRLSALLAILRASGARVPESARIESGEAIAKPERDEWLVLSYATVEKAPRPTIRSAKGNDVRKGRLAPYVPVANRRSW